MNHRHQPWATADHPVRRAASSRPSGDRPAARTTGPENGKGAPRFLTAVHADPFWQRQARLLTDTWRSAPTAPFIGLTWDRGRVIGDATWKDILSEFNAPITCNPQHPDTALLQRLGDGLVSLQRMCSDYRLDHFTSARILETFLASVLFESEISA